MRLDPAKPKFERLFSNFVLGRARLRNRAVVLPYGTGMVRDGAVTDLDIEHFRRIASTRPGLIITGATVVHPTSAMRVRKLVEAYNEDALESLHARCEAIHQYGVTLYGQILHLGREWIGMDADFAPVAPSAIRSPRDPYPPHELDRSEIAIIVDSFARSARNLQRAGYDGVEIHGAHGYLVAQFLSSATNQRGDEYGGSPEHRLRFLIEIIEAIRILCGDDFGLSVRLSADEEVVDGLEIPDTVRIAESLARHGAINVLNITMGTRGGYVKDMTEPDAPAENAAKSIRHAAGLPVIVGQRISRPEVAERLLINGSADLVGMARAFFADPDFLIKAESGTEDRIRPCLNLNQDCRAFSPHLHCAVNPVTGRERLPEFAELLPAPEAKRVAVVGGGPAGLEVALTAALRGHDVSLFEASTSFGGQFLIAASVPHRDGLRRLVDYQVAELRRTSAKLNLDTEIRTSGCLGADFDAAVVATGAVPGPLGEHHLDAGVMRWFEVLSEGAPQPQGLGKAVFVDDGTGFWWNYGVAEALIVAGWQVTIITPSVSVAHMIPVESVSSLLGRLAIAQTDIRTLTTLESISEDEVVLQSMLRDQPEILRCDLVVAQTGRLANPGPLSVLRDAGISEVHSIGDCVAPRRVSFAIYEAQRLGRTL